MNRQQRRLAERQGRRTPDRSRNVRTVLIALAAAGAIAIGLWLVQRGDAVEDVVRDGAPGWSPDGKQIVFYSERGGAADLFLADRAGANRRALTSTPADEGGPVFSPDGQFIAYDSDAAGNFDVYVMRADGTGIRRLTSHPSRDVSPAWSPDGTRLVFMSARENPEFDIYEMDTNGGSVRRLTQGGSNWFPQYAPDGSRIAMHVMRDVHTLDTRTNTLQRLTQDPQNGMHPSWSPDGRQIAFMSWRNGRTEIFLMNADGSDQRLTISMPDGDAVDPRWSPQGDAIAFVHVPKGGLGQAQDAHQTRVVYTFDLATRAMTRISR